MLDRLWAPPALLVSHKKNKAVWLALTASAALLLLWQPQQLSYALATLLFAALPEEWFFRAYFMIRLRQNLGSNMLAANLVTSLVFSLLHGLTQSWTQAVLVFLPSLAFGWFYQRSRDIVLVILTHGLSNLLYASYLYRFIDPLRQIF